MQLISHVSRFGVPAKSDDNCFDLPNNTYVIKHVIICASLGAYLFSFRYLTFLAIISHLKRLNFAFGLVLR